MASLPLEKQEGVAFLQARVEEEEEAVERLQARVVEEAVVPLRVRVVEEAVVPLLELAEGVVEVQNFQKAALVEEAM